MAPETALPTLWATVASDERMIMRFARLGLTLALVVAALTSGCTSKAVTRSQASVPSPAPSTPAAASAAPESPAPTEAAATDPSVMLDVTDEQGWHYTVMSALPPVPTFSKDISSAPPGKAGFSSSYHSTDPVLTQSVPDDNPGRPNGPALEVSATGVAWASEKAAIGDVLGCTGNNSGGLGQATGYAKRTADSRVDVIIPEVCSYPIVETDRLQRGEYDEAVVDRLVASIRGLPVLHRMFLRSSNVYCSILIGSDGLTYYDTDQRLDGGCNGLTKVTATVTG